MMLLPFNIGMKQEHHAWLVHKLSPTASAAASHPNMDAPSVISALPSLMENNMLFPRTKVHVISVVMRINFFSTEVVLLVGL